MILSFAEPMDRRPCSLCGHKEPDSSLVCVNLDGACGFVHLGCFVMEAAKRMQEENKILEGRVATLEGCIENLGRICGDS